jgi:hypothetical protein
VRALAGICLSYQPWIDAASLSLSQIIYFTAHFFSCQENSYEALSGIPLFKLAKGSLMKYFDGLYLDFASTFSSIVSIDSQTTGTRLYLPPFPLKLYSQNGLVS